jgi:hypothetical protein
MVVGCMPIPGGTPHIWYYLSWMNHLLIRSPVKIHFIVERFENVRNTKFRGSAAKKEYDLLSTSPHEQLR